MSNGRIGKPGDPMFTLQAGARHGVFAMSGRVRGDDGRGYDRSGHIIEDAVGALDTVKPWNVLDTRPTAMVDVAQPVRTNHYNNSDAGMEAQQHILHSGPCASVDAG